MNILTEQFLHCSLWSTCEVSNGSFYHRSLDETSQVSHSFAPGSIPGAIRYQLSISTPNKLAPHFKAAFDKNKTIEVQKGGHYALDVPVYATSCRATDEKSAARREMKPFSISGTRDVGKRPAFHAGSALTLSSRKVDMTRKGAMLANDFRKNIEREILLRVNEYDILTERQPALQSAGSAQNALKILRSPSKQHSMRCAIIRALALEVRSNRCKNPASIMLIYAFTRDLIGSSANDNLLPEEELAHEGVVCLLEAASKLNVAEMQGHQITRYLSGIARRGVMAAKNRERKGYRTPRRIAARFPGFEMADLLREKHKPGPVRFDSDTQPEAKAILQNLVRDSIPHDDPKMTAWISLRIEGLKANEYARLLRPDASALEVKRMESAIWKQRQRFGDFLREFVTDKAQVANDDVEIDFDD